MDTSFFTLAGLAKTLCEADARPADDKGAIWNQLRSLHQRAFIRETDRLGAAGASRFTLEEACRARLLLALIDAGIEASAGANAGITDSGRTVYADGSSREYTLSAFIEAARNGEKWVLRVNVGRDQCEGGRKTVSAKLLPSWEAARALSAQHPNGDPTHPDSDGVFLGFTHLAYVKIPASDLIKPLLVAE